MYYIPTSGAMKNLFSKFKTISTVTGKRFYVYEPNLKLNLRETFRSNPLMRWMSQKSTKDGKGESFRFMPGMTPGQFKQSNTEGPFQWMPSTRGKGCKYSIYI